MIGRSIRRGHGTLDRASGREGACAIGMPAPFRTEVRVTAPRHSEIPHHARHRAAISNGRCGTMWFTAMIEQWVNDRTFHVCGLRRSGNHAVIQWILANSGVTPCFLNDCVPGGNPYNGQRPKDNRVPPGFDLNAERRGRWSRKPFLMCSYEDRELEQVYPAWFASAMEQWLGPSRRATNILILRDAFNLIASKYRWAVDGTRWQPPMHALAALPALWKTYAREFLGLTSIMPAPVVRISYNRWFTDAAYRRDLARTLEISTEDKGREEVARWGPNNWGDSFDNLNYDGRATEMKVLDRWQLVADQPLYRSLVSDPELVELSTAIFGSLPGTERLAR